MAEQDEIEKRKTWERLKNAIGKDLMPIDRRKSWRKSIDGKVSFYLAYSKFYPEGSRYWYGIKEEDFAIWEKFERSFVIFILDNSGEVIVVPTRELHKGLLNSYIQPTSGERYKIHILRENDKFHFLEIENLDINPYFNCFNQVTISSASDFDDSEYEIGEQTKEYQLTQKRIYGRGGESKEHKEFKEYVSLNADLLGMDKSLYSVETEFILPSTDAIDVMFSNAKERIGVEVKSKISSIDDITRGLFQCIKYTALLNALSLAEKKSIQSRTILVLEASFPEQLLELKAILGVEVIDNIVKFAK